MLTSIFYRNPRLTLLSVCLILVAGIFSFLALPRLEDPLITSRFASVKTDFPGASAEQVNALVAERIEPLLFEIDEVQEIKTVSRVGFCEMVVILEEEVAPGDVAEVWSRIRAKLDDAASLLPEGASSPILRSEYVSAHTFVAALTWQLESPPDTVILSRLASEFERKLKLTPGTLRTEIFGAAEEEVAVTYDPAILASAGLGPGDLSNAIQGANVQQPAGQIREGNHQFGLTIGAPFENLFQVMEAIVQRTPGGQTIRVGDVADVRKSQRAPTATMALVDGRPAVLVTAIMGPGWRIDEWSANTRALLDTFSKALPSGVEARTLFDQSVYVESRIDDLLHNLLLALGTVLLVVCLTMGLPAGLAVGSILPLASAIVIAFMFAMGFSLHQVSITGLIVALGILIDNAIVSVDEFNRIRARGLDTATAISDSAGHLFVPLLASTITTILTFLPMTMLPGSLGEFVGGLGMSVILAVAASFVLALTIVPALAGRFLEVRPIPARTSAGSWLWTGVNIPSLNAGLQAVFSLVLRFPRTMALVAISPALLGFAISGHIERQFFPPTDRDQFQISVVLRSQTALDVTLRVVNRVRDHLSEEPAILSDTWMLGASPPRVYYNVTLATDRAPNAASAFVNTRSAAETRDLLPRLQRDLMTLIPEAEVLVLPFEQGPLYDAPVEVELFGPDMVRLREIGEQVRQILSQSQAVTFTRATLTGGQPTLDLAADRDVIRLTDFTLADLASRMASHLDGIESGSLLEGTEELPIRVRAVPAFRQDLSRIATTPIPSPRSVDEDEPPGIVPLNSIGTLTLRPALNRITRYQGEHVNRIQAFLMPFSNPAMTVADFKLRLEAANFALPPGYHLSFGGEARESSKSQAALLAFVGPLLIVLGATIVLAFNSFRMAGIILCVAFLSIGMALFAIWVLGRPLGFMTVLGAMGLVGIAVNDAIVVLTALRSDPQARQGDHAAIRATVGGCTRHVLSTTLTTIAGFLPLILFGGSFWQPLAIAIAAGVSGATILALVLVPAAFLLMHRRPMGPEALPSTASPA